MDVLQINDWTNILDILEFVENLITVVVGGLLILFLWHRLKPWIESQDRKTLEKKQRIEKLYQILRSDQLAETRKKASIEFWKLVAVDGIQIVLLVFAFVLIVMLMPKVTEYFQSDFWETRNEIVQKIDETKSDLYLKTVREPLDPVCIGEMKQSNHENDLCTRYWDRQQDMLHRQLLCISRALLESRKFQNTIDDIRNIGITRMTYQVCMMEKGWYTEPCFKEEKDCVELVYAESTCTSITRDWLKDGGDDMIIRKVCEALRL